MEILNQNGKQLQSKSCSIVKQRVQGKSFEIHIQSNEGEDSKCDALLSLHSSMSENVSPTLSWGRVSEESGRNPHIVKGITLNSKIVYVKILGRKETKEGKRGLVYKT